MFLRPQMVLLGALGFDDDDEDKDDDDDDDDDDADDDDDDGDKLSKATGWGLAGFMIRERKAPPLNCLKVRDVCRGARFRHHCTGLPSMPCV